MSNITFTVTYDGSDQQIINALSRMVSVFAQTNGVVANNAVSSQSVNPNSSHWAKNVAAKFAGYVVETARRGEKSQRACMEVWLKHDGRVPLSQLVKASGVEKTHDYAGVGSSLSRNMKKAGGPKKWYDVVRDLKGERIYQIVPELVELLKEAFNI